MGWEVGGWVGGWVVYLGELHGEAEKPAAFVLVGQVSFL